MIHFGDCREVMPRLIESGARAQMCVTSPPYWNLRSYLPVEHPDKGAELGLESNHDCLGWATGVPCGECHICHMVAVFRLVRDLLADDGTCWVNYGDSYAAGGSGDIGHNSTLSGSQRSQRAARMPWGDKSKKPPPGLKPKDLCMIPARLALALQADGWWLRQDIIWHKPNPMPESIRDRCTKAHEYLFLLSKSEHYYFDFEAFAEPVNGGAHARGPGNRTHKGTQAYLDGADEHRTKAGLVAYADRQRAKRQKTPDGWDTGAGAHGNIHRSGREKGATRDVGVGPKARPRKGAPNELVPKYNEDFAAACVDLVDKRNRRSVWTVATEAYSEAHFATFPRALIAPCIIAGSRLGDVVFDPFLGSGTSAQVAQSLGRQFLGIELNREYQSLQRQRIAQLAMTL